MHPLVHVSSCWCSKVSCECCRVHRPTGIHWRVHPGPSALSPGLVTTSQRQRVAKPALRLMFKFSAAVAALMIVSPWSSSAAGGTRTKCTPSLLTSHSFLLQSTSFKFAVGSSNKVPLTVTQHRNQRTRQRLKHCIHCTCKKKRCLPPITTQPRRHITLA